MNTDLISGGHEMSIHMMNHNAKFDILDII
jgi:hypothetical protein